ncbi:alpha/beta fold hydrolase [Flindersiella endophytica]
MTTAPYEQDYRDLLGQWPVPSLQRHLPTREGDTFVISSGPDDAPPLVLLHGSNSNSLMWLAEIENWSAYFRVHAVDTIGDPGLSQWSRPPLASGRYAPWLADVFDGLDLDRAAIVGVSLGGWFAIDFAVSQPERVERMALMCPGGVGKQKYAKLLVAPFLMLFGDWGRRKTFKLIAGIDHDYGVQLNKQSKPRREKLPIFTGEQLERLTMPIYVAVGGKDAMLDSRQTKERFEKHAKHVTVDLRPEAGHFVPGVSDSVLEFLRNPR